MSDALTWLDRHAADAPEHLRARMRTALRDVRERSVHESLAAAALHCLRASLTGQPSRECALDLLSADALFTHACAAAAEAGQGELERFTAALDAARFQQLLDQSA